MTNYFEAGGAGRGIPITPRRRLSRDSALGAQDEAIKCRYCGTMLDGSATPERFERTSSDGVRLEAMRLLNSEGKIHAIKFVREKKGLGLAQAKAYVDALASGANPDDAARSVAARSGGCGPVVAFLLFAIAALVWWLSR